MLVCWGGVPAEPINNFTQVLKGTDKLCYFQDNLNIKCAYISSPCLTLANSQDHTTGKCQLI